MEDIELRLIGTSDITAIHRGLATVQAETRTAANVLGGLGNLMKGLFAGAAIAGVIRYGQGIDDLSDSISVLRDVCRKYGVDAEDMAKTLRDATDGDISYRESILLTSKVIQSMGELGIKNIGAIGEMAQKMTGFGIEAADAIDMIVRALATGRFSQLKELAPALKDIPDLAKDSAAGFRALSDALSEIALPGGDPFTRLKNSLEGFMDALGVTFFAGGTDIGQGTAAIARQIDRLADSIKALGSPENVGKLDQIRATLGGIATVGAALVAANYLGKFLAPLTEITTPMGQLTAQLTGQAGAFAGLKIQSALAGSELRKTAGAITAYQDIWEDLNEDIRTGVFESERAVEIQKELTDRFGVAYAKQGEVRAVQEGLRNQMNATTLAIKEQAMALLDYAGQLLLVAAEVGALILAVWAASAVYKKNIQEQRKLQWAVEDTNEVYEKAKENLGAVTSRFDDMRTILDSVTESSQLTQEQIDELKNGLSKLNEQFPGLIEQTGYAVDENNNLYDAAGNAVTGIDTLQTAVNAFNTATMISEVRRAIEALQLLSQAKLAAAIGPEPSITAIPPAERGKYIQEQLDKEGLTGWARFYRGEQLRTTEFMLPDIGAGIRALQEAIFGTTTMAVEDAEREMDRLWNDLLNRVKGLEEGGGVVTPRGGRGGAGAGSTAPRPVVDERLRRWTEALAGFYQQETVLHEKLNRGLITEEAYRSQYNSLMSGVIDTMLNLNAELPLSVEHTAVMNAWIERYIAQLIDLTRLSETNAKLQRELNQDLQAFLDAGVIPPVGTLAPQEPVNAPMIEKLDETLNDFCESFASILGRFLEDWGWEGGKKSTSDWLGLARQIGQPAFKEWGEGISSAWGLDKIMGGAFTGIPGMAVSGLIGFGLNRMFNREQKVKIDQKVDVNIASISPQAMDLFNWRYINPYQSRFRGVVEYGLW